VYYRIVDENEKKEIGMPAGFREQDLVNYTIRLCIFHLNFYYNASIDFSLHFAYSMTYHIS